MKKLLLILTIVLLAYSSITTYKLINKSPNNIVQHDTIPGDTVFNTITKTQLVPYKVTEYNVDTIEIPADTAELVRRYRDVYSRLYASKSHRDTLKNDSSATVILNTYLSRNCLDSLVMRFKNNRVTAINNTTIINEPTFKAGCIIGFNEVSPIISYKYRSFNILGGYNLIQNKPIIGLLYNIK